MLHWFSFWSHIADFYCLANWDINFVMFLTIKLTDIHDEKVYVSIHFLHCRVSIYENHTCLTINKKRYLFLSDDSANKQTNKLYLSNEWSKIICLKVFWKNFFSKLIWFLDFERFPVFIPADNLCIFWILQFISSQQTYT